MQSFIAGYLIAKGYKVSYETITNVDETKLTSFFSGPATGADSVTELNAGDVLVDRNAAVNADTQQDGHINKGLQPASQASGGSQNGNSLVQLRDTLFRPAALAPTTSKEFEVMSHT